MSAILLTVLSLLLMKLAAVWSKISKLTTASSSINYIYGFSLFNFFCNLTCLRVRVVIFFLQRRWLVTCKVDVQKLSACIRCQQSLCTTTSSSPSATPKVFYRPRSRCPPLSPSQGSTHLRPVSLVSILVFNDTRFSSWAYPEIGSHKW